MLFRRIPAALGIAGLLILPATAAQAEVSEQDAAFLRSAHQVNLAEVAASRIAWSKTTDPSLKKLAGALMIDHLRMDSDLYRTARKLRVFLPDSPTLEQQALANRYLAAGVDTFDEYFISTQLAGHRAAVRMVSAQADEGSDSSVKELAARAAPIIVRHQQMLREAAAAEGMAGYAGAGGREG